MRILASDAVHTQYPKNTLGVHLPSALADRVARPGPPWRGLHCCSSPSSAPGAWNLQIQSSLRLCKPTWPCPSMPQPPTAPTACHNLETPKPHLRDMWLEVETSGVPRAPHCGTTAPDHTPVLKLGGTSSKHGDILIYSLVPKSSEAQGGHMPALPGLSPGHLKQDLVNPRGGFWEP